MTAGPKAETAGSSGASPGGEARRVLVASRDRDARRLLAVGLRRGGFEVALAATGKEVVSGAVAKPPAVVVLERDLPHLRGDEALKNLESFASTRQVPAIFMIDHSREVEPLALLRPSSDRTIRVVRKPFSMKKLLEAIETALAAPRPES